MAIIVTEDIEGQSIDSGPDNEIHTVPVLITGLDKLPATNVLQRALNALDQNGYTMFSPKKDTAAQSGPFLPPPNKKKEVGIRLQNRRVTNFQNARDKARAFLTYVNYNYLIIRINGTTLRLTTRFDVNGDLLKVGYDPKQVNPLVDVTSKPSATTEMDYGHENVLRPLLTMEFEWVQETITQTDAMSYQGRINEKKWQGGEAHTWLCTAFNTQPIDNFGRSSLAKVQCAFQFLGFKASTGIIEDYDPVEVYTRRDTRKPPDGLDPGTGLRRKIKAGNGYKKYQTIFAADFNKITSIPNLFK